jgi:hypothetical protein
MLAVMRAYYGTETVMQAKVSLIAFLAVGVVLATPSALARGSSSGTFVRASSGASASTHFAVQSRSPVLLKDHRRVIVDHRHLAAHPAHRHRHIVFVARPILITSPAFVTPVFVVVRPVCCG